MAEQTLDSVVPSAKARKALAAGGITTPAELFKADPKKLMKIGVGESTILDLMERGAVEKKAPSVPQAEALEEGDHPIRLQSPFRGYQIQLCPGYEERFNAGGRRVHLGIYLKFDDGSAKLTKELWNERVARLQALAKTDTERTSVQLWSRPAVAAWLKARRAYGIDYFIVPE